METRLQNSRAILFALTGFTLWVLSDSCMKLAGQAYLPPYEVVGILGFFAVTYLGTYYAAQGKLLELWPKRPARQALRAAMTFGCVMANAITLNHVPLTMFYVIIFLSPMLIAVLAAMFLREYLRLAQIVAIVAGFAGVIIAINPWSNFGGGDWIGYAAGIASALFFAAATILMRYLSHTETIHSMTFMTGLVECVLGFGLMAWHAVAFTPLILLTLAGMTVFNVIGNLMNAQALRLTTAATVEQFHYTQIIAGALIGYLIWHEVPVQHTVIGAVVIIGSGLYVATTMHKAEKLATAQASQAAQKLNSP